MNRIVLAVSTSPHPVRRVRARLPAFSRTLAAVALFVPALLTSPLASAADAASCSNTSTGNTPLNDLGTGTYQGDQGGLYPGGSNTRPPAHDAAGLVLAEGVQPMDAAGAPDPNGKYVLLSIGMSNATIEFQAFMPPASSDPDKDPNLVIVDGAASGADADSIANPAAPYWQAVDQRLAETGVTDQQVAVAWVKEAIAHPTTGFPEYPEDLEGDQAAISEILHQRFPNLRLAYYSSRTYGGYATTDLNPEAYAYWSGFADKWLIEDQINDDPDLNYDPTKGTVQAPWMSWGPYLWADGLAPRSDGLTWLCDDFRDDGTHPSDLGASKVANMLLDFFKTDSTAREWFLATATAPPSLSVNDVSQNEGNAGTTDFAFTVSRMGDITRTSTVSYATKDGTATTADNDYSAASGTVTFVPGDTSEAVHVTVNADTKFEQNETFTVDLSNASEATIADGQGGDDPGRRAQMSGVRG
jgi:hypothetical protein